MGVIECLEERGLVDALTSEDLRQVTQKSIKAYIGFDPTADSLHLGSLMGIVILKWFQKYGHTPVVILGGATGSIGDPSGKNHERTLLEDSVIEYNVSRIRLHFEQVLDFFHPTSRPLILNNKDWMRNCSCIDFLRDVGKYFRVGTMLTKESVRSRIESEEGISFTEFSYQLLQAYDFYYLLEHHGVSLQMGGSDQWGNITAGIDFIRKKTGKTSYGLTFPLLTRSDGKKFGKTEEGAIWLAADRCSPYQFYQYLYGISDDDVIKMMRFLTFMEMEEIHKYEKAMKSADYVPNSAQKRLAEEVTRMIHEEEGVQKALKVTKAAGPGGNGILDADILQEIVKDMPHILLAKHEVVGQKFVDLAVKIGFLQSKGEATRLIAQGGAYLNNEKMEDSQLKISQDHLIGGEFLLFSAGKKKKILLKVR